MNYLAAAAAPLLVSVLARFVSIRRRSHTLRPKFGARVEEFLDAVALDRFPTL